MPERDKIVNLGGTIKGFPELPDLGNITNNVPKEISMDELYLKGARSIQSKGIADIPLSSIYTGDRYPETRPGTDYEEMAAQQQSAWNKWGNALAKTAGVATTSFVSGTAGLLNGIGSSIINWNFSKLFDNDTTRLMNRSMEGMEDIFPNYYSKNEQDADWWTSDNLLTANFWGDKVMKNIGYSLGSIGGGVVWSKAFKLIGATNTMVKAGAGIEAATAAEAAMTNVPKLQKFAALESALNTVSQTYIKSPAAAILKDSDRILTSVMGTFGEASLESLQNSNAFRKQAIEDYRNTYGVDPTGADLENINAYANKVGNYTWGLNTLLLSATNYIQLPKILGSSRRAEKALINEIEQKQLGGAWAEALPGTRLGKLTDKVTGVGKYLFSPTEAFEEGAQFAIQVGTNDFFDRAYENKNELNSFLSAVNDVMGNVLDKGVDETLNTKEGLENILIGGISGGIQQIRGTIKDRRLARNNTGIALGALNKTNIDAQLKDQAKFLSIGVGSQKLRQQAIKNNDVLSEKDYEKDFVLSYIMPRAKYGKSESIFQELGYYKSQAMTEVGFNELSTNGIAAPNETREQFIQRINNLEALTKTVDGFYDAINNKYSGLVDANGKRVYPDSVIDKMVYSTAKINDYDLRIPALTLSLTNAGINTAEILTDIIETGTPNKQATLSALDSINKMDVLSDVKDDLKRDLSDIIELSLRRKQFIDEYDAIKKAPQLYELGVEFDFSREEEPVVVEQFGVPEGKKRKKVFEKEVEFGKEYSLKDPIRREDNQIQLSPTLTVIGRNLGGEYEVRLPNGTEKFLTPEQFRAYELADSPMESAKLQELMDKSIDTVLNKKKYADISKPTENKLQYVNSLNNKGLMDDVEKEFKKRSEEFVKQQTKDREKRAKLSKYAEQIRKTQQAIVALSGDAPTGEDKKDKSSIWEDPRKMFKRLFTSTTTGSREWSKQGLAAHIIRYNEFINNVKNFKNRDALKVILVTPKFAESLGLQGLAEMSFEAGGLNVKDINDPLTGFVGAVFIEVDKNNKKYFVDKNGERIAEVGPNATPALNRIVFSTMPSVNLYWSKGQPKFRDGEEREATSQAAAWQKMREQLFTTAPTQLYDFGVSKGAPVMNKENPETNFVGDVIVPANKIGTEQVVMVSTKGSIAHEDGNNYAFPVGRPVVKYGDILTYLNNRTFNKNEAQTIFQILKNLSDVANDEADQGATLTFDPRKVAFLRDIMYWNDKGDPTNNKIYLDPDTQELVLGMDAENKEIRYPFANIGNFENQIVTQLQGMFNSVNNKTLNRGMGESFTEFYLDKEGKLAERTWKNYQDYLLSSKLPDGSSRSIKDAPLFTNISKPTNEVPYAFDRKYAYLKMELDAPAQPIVKEQVEGEGMKVGNYELNNGKVNDYNVPNMGAIQFTATIDDKGEINVTTVISPTTEATYQAISQNKDLMTAVKKNLVDIGAFVEGKDDIDYVAEAAPNLIKIALVKARQAEAPAAPIAPAPTAAPVSDVEAKKADIEKRRQEDINKRKKSAKLPGAKVPTEMWNKLMDKINAKYDAELAALEEVDTLDEVQTRLNEDLGVTSKITTDAYLNGLHYLQTEDGKYYVIPDSTAAGYGDESAKEVTKEQIIKPFRTEAEWKKVGIGVDVTQQKTLFRAFEKAFYEGNDKRYENISDETLAKLSSATRQYLLNLYEALKPYNSTFQRLGKILDTQTSKELTTDDEKIKYVTSSYFGGLGRGSSEMGSSTNPKHKDLVMPVPSADVLGNINEVFGAKLTDAELAALEGAKPAEEKPNVADPGPAPTTEPKNFKGRKRADDPRYRRAGSLAVERMTEAELQEFKEWAAKNLPQIPYEVLEHMVNTHDNKKAWGVFEDGVAKFYKSAEKGTAYHELFEGVWKGLLSENMQQDLIDEFRERKGSFIDRASGRRIDFNEATNEEAREYIADEFAAFRAGKATARTLSQKLVDFFRSIINFFKSFVNKPTLKDELFKAIEKGEFKQKAYKDTNPSQMAAYRRVTGLNEQQTNEFVQDMTARLFQYVFNTNTSLFSPARITAGEIFGNIKEQFKNEGVFDYITDDTYNQLIDRTKEYLKYYRIEFDEDSRIGVNDEGATNRNYAAETFSVDFKKASPYAVKLLIGTLIKTKTTNQENSLSVTLPLYDEDASSTGGYTLVPFGKAFTTLMNTLSNTLDINQFVDKLYKLALQDGDYVRLFTRLGGDLSTGKIDFQGYKEPHDWRLFINFYQVFTKQNPNAVAQFVDEEKVYLASANQASTAKQFEKEWLNNMLLMADEPGTFIQLDRPTKTYKITNTDFKIGTPEEKIAFLNNIGINFTMDAFNKLKGRNIEKFGEAVSGILTSLKKKPALLSLRGKALDIAGNLTTIASLYTRATNPIQDSTFFNMENKRQQSFTDSNTTSVLESIFNSVSTRDELFEKLPRLRDVFSTNSQVLKLGGLFFDEEGNRTSRDLKVGYAAGVKDIANNTGKSTASLPLGARFTLEINQNLDGNYYVLIPADSSTEWMMQLGNVVSYADVASNAATEQINTIFKGYLKDEILLAASDKNRAKLKNVAGRGKQLRFFNDILPDSFKEKITSQLIDKNADDVAIDAFLAQDANVEAFEKAIADLIKTSVSQTKTRLIKSKELVVNKKGEYKYAKIDSDFVKDKGINKNNITEDQLTSLLAFTNVNYMINNIELHKILLGDPYQFATKNGKLEETKRVKSYLSPRRITFNIPEFNNFLNDYYNKAGDLQLTDDDYGYHEHKDFARTATISELFVAGSAGSVFPAYLKTKEADAASWMKDTLYREVKLKNGQWSDEAEAWHQWQMAFTRQNIPGYKYINEKLRKQDEALVKKPAPTHFIDVLKPIVTGSKFGRPYTDNVLDKFAQIPLYYSAVKGTSLEKLYIKMFNEGYDYVIMESGRKEGTEEAQPFYQPNGLFNDDAFNNMIDVPWSAYGLQVENSYDKDRGQTRGSQGVKISSMDLFENGQPISEEARKAMDRYNAVLNEMTENAYQEILTRLAIKDLGTSFEVEDKSQVAETLRQQMLKLQLSENAVDSISINPETGEFDIPFEASTNYTQIKQILYAIVNKSITSPKMSGMSAVQIPVTGWENAEEGRSLAIKRDGKYEKISREAFEKLPDDDKKDVVLTDDTLKFYEDKEGKRYCEVMLPNWFKKKLGRDMTDEEFNKFAKTDEGREILTGIGFRIPTQGLNSMDVFVVKGFLPSYMGKTVVVPSEITTKAGSDFDIDKLNTYLKNVYVTGDGKVKLVPYFGLGEEAKKKMGKWLIENDLTTILTDTDYAEYGDREDDYGAIADKLYKQSLENEYYSALQELLTIPQNFKRLMTPNNSKPLEKIATKLDTLRGFNEGNVKNQLINRVFLTGLRHSFVTAKAWVGIAATNITGHSLFQKEKMYVIDPSMTMVLPHNKVDVDGASHISLSGRLDQDGEFISDKLSMYANSFVDVANDPYIFKIIYSDRLVSTFLFLERAGVSMENVAMFMNQPIIREYMNYLDSINASRSGIYKNNNISYVKKMFPASVDLIKNVAININNFEGNISTYASKGSLTEIENAEQQAILAEFLKYAKLSDALFNITQATNYDTSSFKNADDLHRKQLRTDIEEALSMISSPKKILDISFLRGIERALDRATDALGAILKFNQFEFRGVIEDAINVYAANQYLGAEKFTKIAEKVSASFLDYIIQTKIANKLDVNELTASVESVANRIRKAKGQHPEVKMLQLFITEAPDRPGAPKTIALRSNPKEAFDENLHIGYMREMRDNPATADLYKDVVKVAILQGTYQSAVSIKNIVPLEDYAKVVSPIISPLQVDEDIRNFARGRKFERSNWKDENIVPRVTPTIDDENENELGEDIYGNVINQYFYKNFSGIASLGINEADRSILLVSISSKGSNNDVLVIPGIFKMKDEMIDFMRGETITPGDIASRRAQGDRSMDLVHGYMKVRDAFGKPILNPDNKFVYKRINLLGDGQYLTEHYVDNRPSAVDNGTYKVEAEIPDYAIVEAMAELQKTAAPRGFTPTPAKSIAPTAAVTPAPAVSQTEPVYQITKPTRSYKKETYIFKGQDGFDYEKSGYRIFIPGYPNTQLFITKDQLGEVGEVIQGREWQVDEAITSKIFPTTETTIDGILEEIKDTANNLSKNPESLKILKGIGIFQIQPEGLPAIDNNNQNNCG